MSKATYSVSLGGTIISSSLAKSVMLRKTTCNGCGFELSTIMSYEQDRKMWAIKHNRNVCREQKELALAFS